MDNCVKTKALFPELAPPVPFADLGSEIRSFAAGARQSVVRFLCRRYVTEALAVLAYVGLVYL